jgi:hypothetical protein
MRLFKQRSPEEKAAESEFDALLAGMVSGQVDLHGLGGRLRSVGAATGMKEKAQHQRKVQAWQGLAQRTLADDLLTLEEENELADAAQALDLNFDSLMQGSPDLRKRLAIAQANDGRMAVIDQPSLMTKGDEVVHSEWAAQLMKEVVHREYRGGSGGASFRIAKGVSVRTGSSRGQMVETGRSLQPADQGVLSITDRRLVFVGSRKTQECRFDKIVGLEVFSDAIRVAVSNRQTPSLYAVADGEIVAAQINAASQHAD